jgi:hypothetical protein
MNGTYSLVLIIQWLAIDFYVIIKRDVSIIQLYVMAYSIVSIVQMKIFVSGNMNNVLKDN